MAKEKRFIRVRDKDTRHQFDIVRARFDESRHELVKNTPDSNFARPAKPHVPLGGKKTTAKAEEGVSPAPVSEG